MKRNQCLRVTLSLLGVLLFLPGPAIGGEPGAPVRKRLRRPAKVAELVRQDRKERVGALMYLPVAMMIQRLPMAMPVASPAALLGSNRIGYGRKLAATAAVADQARVRPVGRASALWALQTGVRALPRARKRRFFPLSRDKGNAVASDLVTLYRHLVHTGVSPKELARQGLGRDGLRSAIEAAGLNTSIIQRLQPE